MGSGTPTECTVFPRRPPPPPRPTATDLRAERSEARKNFRVKRGDSVCPCRLLRERFAKKIQSTPSTRAPPSKKIPLAAGTAAPGRPAACGGVRQTGIHVSLVCHTYVRRHLQSSQECWRLGRSSVIEQGRTVSLQVKLSGMRRQILLGCAMGKYPLDIHARRWGFWTRTVLQARRTLA